MNELIIRRRRKTATFFFFFCDDDGAQKKNLQLWRRGRTPPRRATAQARPVGPLSERCKDIPLVHRDEDNEARVRLAKQFS